MKEKLLGIGVTVFRGDRCLFRDLSFALERGELLLLKGKNGSGKTSLLQAMAGLLPLEGGEISWAGKPITHEPQAFRGTFAWFGHRTGLKADLSPRENLRFDTCLRASKATGVDRVFARLGLERWGDLPVRLLSAGQQRRVALARLLLADVPLWLVDEPFTNLDRDGRQLVLDIVSEHIEAGGLCALAAHQDVSIRGAVRRLSLS